MRRRAERRCPRWLGLPKGDLAEPPNLRQVPLIRRRPLWWKMPLLTWSQGTSNSRMLSKQKNSLIATPSSPEPMSGDEDSSEEEMSTDSLTSHTTASGSTNADFLPSTASAVEDISNIPPSLTESQFSTVMPYLQESTQPDQTWQCKELNFSRTEPIFLKNISFHQSNWHGFFWCIGKCYTFHDTHSWWCMWNVILTI